MKKYFKKCRLIGIILIGWLVLSGFGYAGKDSIYQEYSVNAWKTPYFSLVFQGLHDEIYPWNLWIAKKPEKMEPPKTPEQVEDTEMETLVVPETEEEAPILEFTKVDESYFDDAVFIGDSRTVGLHDYGDLNNATFYATIGMNIYDLWTDEFCEVDGRKVTLEEALKARKFGKIYFQIGINEMGRGTVDGFMEEYQETVEKFRELQPDAVIFVQGIMRVAAERSNTDPIFNNQGINERNARIAALADNRKIFYIDVNEVVCDENGDLRADLTFDNLHLYGSKYGIWRDFLMEKGIVPPQK